VKRAERGRHAAISEKSTPQEHQAYESAGFAHKKARDFHPAALHAYVAMWRPPTTPPYPSGNAEARAGLRSSPAAGGQRSTDRSGNHVTAAAKKNATMDRKAGPIDAQDLGFGDRLSFCVVQVADRDDMRPASRHQEARDGVDLVHQHHACRPRAIQSEWILQEHQSQQWTSRSARCARFFVFRPGPGLIQGEGEPVANTRSAEAGTRSHRKTWRGPLDRDGEGQAGVLVPPGD